MKPRVSAILLIVLGLACGGLLTGCALRGGKARPRQARAVQPVVPRLVGTVALVNQEGRFVLIDSGSFATPTSGTALKSFTGDAESAVLSAGEVRRRPFVVADIVKGEPHRGDRVFQ